ncbi:MULTISPECIES: 3-oxoacyl-ACP reductase family protein [Lacticaseibacillus]|uniref:3-oxoacyl-ACP reductase family protein n=2 Tax=Lacticaseibacillus TaxID=2759736 RepID=A0AAN1EZM7_LACCA|nr:MULTISPECIES: 3-oxoacyl-ACP reductase family protein [Lacticaseibacillus]ARY92069.1 beta-ketoacyl-ACP reductase [Lacticaseibacillus casei]KAB1971119.1 3-oxoacyl-ACP reductase FabG [Lacticaseibacillus casei]WLV79974.1 3-oxoacyl-ACP reductase family protein [Lacticaseibacillus sp. NCIMB 15473]WNX23933.1 3-oxoacyl-ACP reductase family protein [Lacticaseibacillus casei]WNX26708.1 3-oxoacyl-ACP reductase family protein [Lacticaseibacillus casei]
MKLTDKTAIITGASRGIGEAIARNFAQAGANLVLNARHEFPETLIKELEGFGHGVVTVLGSVDDPTTGEQLVAAALDQFGSVDILVNNAGINDDMLAMRMKPATFAKVIQVNLDGTFYVTQPTFKKMMKARAGVIINLASVVGLTGNIGQANYAASKAGIIGLTKTLAREGAMRGVRVNAIAPGMIATDMTAALSQSSQDQILAEIPLKRFGQPEEIAHTARFLVENAYITGQTLTVAGGLG